MKKLKQGPPSQVSTDLGPQADSIQLSSVSHFLEIGKKDGEVLVGGEQAKELGANFVQPTVFLGVQDDSDINQREVFGPVLVLHEFESEEDAIRRANDTECEKTVLY